ncbi:MAG: hypothetical protein WAV28_00765 [Sedimentisphaerales bacterium]|jgi:hypothetical protein
MDNFDNINLGGQNLNKPIPPGKDINNSIPFDDSDAGGTGVSHSPLDLGGSSPVEIPKIDVPKPFATRPGVKVASTERITGVKTFFTKLHPGAMNFLDEQITKWLEENPNVKIKRTNIVTGEIQSKKTEPNIIITVWY